ncbi:preprotein translocase subunit SecA [Lacunimicrobium album]
MALKRRSRRFVHQVLHRVAQIENCSSREFVSMLENVREELQDVTKVDVVRPEVFSLVYLAIKRILGISLFPVQIAGGYSISTGSIAEMATGEGKTVTAVQAAAMWGLMGHGCHVITTNDYLAQRDAEELRDVYLYLGLSVGCLTAEMEPYSEARQLAYQSDITYGTAKEFGFDFLRDRMKLGPETELSTIRRDLHAGYGSGKLCVVQRPLFACLVDEADSILIDDARTPLIIGQAKEVSKETRHLLAWCLEQVRVLERDVDYVIDTRFRQAYITEVGERKIVLAPKPMWLPPTHLDRLLTWVERMLTACFCYHRDQHYEVKKDEIVLTDASTGRPLEGRKLQQGLHQCIEMKEHVVLSPETKTAAKITVQSFFRQYRYVGGMTGTAWNARRELRRIYRLKTQTIPTNRKNRRETLPPRVFVSLKAKYVAIAADVKERVANGQAVLIGTPSIMASEMLAEALHAQGVWLRILNARHESIEAEIVSQAGRPKSVTIATNMAGRGTDIKLTPEVREAGGLHVIATEVHASARIDRQLVGRSARQGDPGSCQFYVSLEDELFDQRPVEVRLRLLRSARPDQNGELSPSYFNAFKREQRRIERRDYKQRGRMFKHEQEQLKSYKRLGWSFTLEHYEDD